MLGVRRRLPPFRIFPPPFKALSSLRDDISPMAATTAAATGLLSSSFHFFCLLLLCHITATIAAAATHTTSSVTSSSSDPNRSNLRAQALALLNLKRSLQDPLGRLRPWRASAHPCQWPGISCTTISWPPTLAITSLDISSRNLSGQLPPNTLSHLPFLQYLSLADNRLCGPLPADLPLLPHLLSLNLSNNLFAGSFPANISLLSSLRSLDAFNNNFGSDLPPHLALLPRLRHLHLGGNFFSGSIPHQYGAFPRLQYLALAGNNLTGRIPAQLGNLRRLRFLYLGYFNTFDGSIPMEMGSMASLEVLDLSETGLNGVIPPSLGSLPNLNTLFLQNNSLVGAIPAELGQLTRMKSLDLSNNHLSGTIPVELCSLTKLEFLALLFNRLHGEIPECIGDLPNLQVLKLFNNNLTGFIPQQLGKVSLGLRQLDLSDNQLTGRIPGEICSGGNLEWLLLLGNELSGEIPGSLAGCRKLIRIRLGNNRLSGTIPAVLFFFSNLDILELSSNHLHGPALPDFSAGISVVGIVNLGSNNLSGPLPHSIANMTGLEKLDLSNNAINGSIPSEIGLLTQKLSMLDLSGNLLVGSFPDVSKCSHLSSLNVSYNSLLGPIPPSLQSMKQLVSVDLSFNNFSGVAPPQSGIFTAQSLRGNPFLCGNLVSKVCDSGGVFNQEAEPPDAGAASKHGAAGSEHGGSFFSVGVPLLLFLAAAVLLCAMVYAWSFRRMVSKRVSFSVSDLDGAAAEEWCRRLWRTRGTGGKWKLVRFEALDFNIDHVLSCLKDENIIGQGGTGTVYKGVMPGGRTLAVKRLPAASGTDVASASSRERLLHDHGFSSEIQTLANVSHRHIVKLLGWCSNGNTNLLLYDYMPNGSLGELLHGSRTVLYSNIPGGGGHFCCEQASPKNVKEFLGSWQARVKLAIGAAEGLAYLHHDCFPPILHRDVKPNNILLDSRWEAKVADFGLAKHMLGTDSSMSVIAGSYGYMAPEYAYTYKVNEKSDVYSYGVVLLELLTGRKPIGAEYGECVDMVRWARGKVVTEEGRMEMVDGRIRTSLLSMDTPAANNDAALLLLFTVAMKCVEELPENRPSLRDVVKDLKSVISAH